MKHQTSVAAESPKTPQPSPAQCPATNKKGDPISKFVMITPDMAVEWLEKYNTLNRGVRDSLVSELARDMAAGRWRGHNGEAVRFDWDERLVDGQHRLWACIEANKPFDTLLVTGVDPADYDTINIGRKKSFADFMREERNRTMLAAVVRLVFVWGTGRLHMEYANRGCTTASIKELQETLAANPDVRIAVDRMAGASSLKGLISLSYASLVYYAAMMAGKRAQAEEFFTRLGDGLALEDNSPIYQLRKVLLANQGARRKMSPPLLLILLIKSWNYFLAGRRTLSMRYRDEEEFPVLYMPGMDNK